MGNSKTFLKELYLKLVCKGLVFLVAILFTSINTNFVLMAINIILIVLLVSLVYFVTICYTVLQFKLQSNQVKRSRR